MLLTNYDGTKAGTLSAIHEAGVPYKKYFLFNNGDIQDRSSHLGKTYWDIGRENCKSFFLSVDAAIPKGLSLTREVMKYRHHQEIALQNLQRSITLNLRTLEDLKNDLNTLKHYEHKKKRNQHLSYEAFEQFVTKEKVHSGYIAINCRRCNVTCYEPVLYEQNEPELLKVFIGQSCSMCFNKCHTNDHECQNFSLVFQKRRV